jgi:hypothetical protein
LKECIVVEKFNNAGFVPIATDAQLSSIGAINNPFIPAPDISNGPSTIVTRSYEVMERDLQAAEKRAKDAESLAEQRIAEASKKADEARSALNTLNKEFTNFKSAAEAEKTRMSGQLSSETSSLSSANGELVRVRSALEDMTKQRDDMTRQRDERNGWIAQKDSEINNLNWLSLQFLDTEDCNVLAVVWGSDCMYRLGQADPWGMVPRIKERIRNNWTFNPNKDFFGGHDPNEGETKHGCIVYRYNRTQSGHGREVRVVSFREGQECRFDHFS